MSERERIQIARAFERQEQFNRFLVYSLLALENDLLIANERMLVEKERVQAMEQIFREKKVFDDFPPELEEPDEEEKPDQLSEILIGLAYDKGPHTMEDLVVEVNRKNFALEKKNLFKTLLGQIGIPVSDLRALKTEEIYPVKHSARRA